MLIRVIVAATVLSSTSCFAAPRYRGPKSDHFNGYFFDNQVPNPRRRLGDFAHWAITRDPPEWPEVIPQEPGPPPPDLVEGADLRVTLVGHSTVLVQTAGLNVLTDPVWSETVGPIAGSGPRRKRAPAIRFRDLPPIDVVLISHNHYDHMDVPTLRRLAEEHSPRIVVGLGVDLLLDEEEIPNGVVLDWWDAIELAPGVRLTATPAQHFSGRGLIDFDRTLWVSYVLEGPGGPVFYAGDTAFGPQFHQVRERFGRARLAIMPIGAYLPRALMAPYHLAPHEAVYASRILGAQTAVPCHYGTFQQTDEAFGQAVTDFRAAFRWDEADHFWILDHGIGRDVPPLPGGG
jgi:L-ascorbate metabolism protein UlaG (beta-lactamase superfamily)